MLKFKKRETTIELLNDGLTILTTRLIDNRMCHFITSCSGTIADFARVANNIANYDNDLYKTFDRIRRDAMKTNIEEGLSIDS